MKDILEAIPRVDPLGPLGGPHDRSKDRKDVKIGARVGRRTIWPWRRVVLNTPNDIGRHGV